MRMIFGAIGGMKIGRGNWSTRRKPAPAPLCPPQNPTWLDQGSNPGPPRWETSDYPLELWRGPSLQFLNPKTVVRIPWKGGWSARRKAATYIGQHKPRINANIHALSGIQTHDHSVRASEGSSCLRPRGHCDWHVLTYLYNICAIIIIDFLQHYPLSYFYLKHVSETTLCLLPRVKCRIYWAEELALSIGPSWIEFLPEDSGRIQSPNSLWSIILLICYYHEILDLICTFAWRF
jgi:hypothetical protein